MNVLAFVKLLIKLDCCVRLCCRLIKQFAVFKNLTENMNEIEGIAKQRNIRWLVHFTRVENLESILKNGLIPRNNFEELDNEPLTNDKIRLDGYLNATSLSIEFPNYRMFWKCRCDAKEKDSIPHETWVVLGIKTSVLWEKDCAFCLTNAAHNIITQTDLEERKGRCF